LERSPSTFPVSFLGRVTAEANPTRTEFHQVPHLNSRPCLYFPCFPQLFPRPPSILSCTLSRVFQNSTSFPRFSQGGCGISNSPPFFGHFSGILGFLCVLSRLLAPGFQSFLPWSPRVYALCVCSGRGGYGPHIFFFGVFCFLVSCFTSRLDLFFSGCYFRIGPRLLQHGLLFLFLLPLIFL